jgi:uncharacterized membrane protein YgcG
MGRGAFVAFLALFGVLCAAGMGYAAYLVSRGSVAVPVTRLQESPQTQLTLARVKAKPRPQQAPTKRPRRTTTAVTTVRTATSPPPTTVDDRSGRGRNGGGGEGGDDGGGNSGRGGGGGRGGDD